MTVIGNYLILGNGGLPISLTVSVDSGAAVTATNGLKTITDISVNDSCTLSLPEPGTWTVSATLNGISSGTKTVTVDDTYSTALYFVNSTLNSNSWAIISDVSSAGEGSNYWSVGDRKAVTLNGTVGACTFSNATYYAFIIGFDHNSTYEGTNRIHFQFGKTALTAGTDVCFIDSKYDTTVNASGYFTMTSASRATNSGGWEASYMRNGICGTSLSSYSGTFMGVLPSELRSVLKSVTKYTDNTGNSSTAAANVTATTDYIFLLAEYEVFGSISYANSNESSKQAQYAYYSAGNSKVKYRHSATSSAAIWWLRSPSRSNDTYFVRAYISGNSSGNSAAYSNGFAPGFCV